MAGRAGTAVGSMSLGVNAGADSIEDGERAGAARVPSAGLPAIAPSEPVSLGAATTPAKVGATNAIATVRRIVFIELILVHAAAFPVGRPAPGWAAKGLAI